MDRSVRNFSDQKWGVSLIAVRYDLAATPTGYPHTSRRFTLEYRLWHNQDFQRAWREPANTDSQTQLLIRLEAVATGATGPPRRRS